MIKNQVVITHRDCSYLQRKRSSVIEWGMSLALVIAFLIFSPSVRAAWSAAAFLPQYNLNVSFDVEASKIFGRAEIHAKAGSELTIHTDNLKIIEATVEGKKTDFNVISLIVSKNFVVSKDTYNGIEIAAYLLPEDAHFAKTFIEHTKRYLKTYEKLLGKYLFKRLSIVEHFEKAGYSMPSYIFLGKDDFKLPIEKSPLGHEIVHQWFGNYVYTDYDRGNWNEGLTIYFADHSYDDIKGTGWKCRRRILSGYKSHVKDKKEFPLREFSGRYDLASRSIGYGTAAMVVHMLRKEAGDRLFYASIRDFIKENKFRVATWDDIKKNV